jgi:hypothetical protein
MTRSIASALFCVFAVIFSAAATAQSTPDETPSFKTVERVSGPSKEELDAYQGMRKRFNERASEFRDGVKRFF